VAAVAAPSDATDPTADPVSPMAGAPDVVVVGRGLFGSAAARHLAERGATVVAVGPAGAGTAGSGPHRVYSSHDDEARLTRLQDRDPRWAPVTARAVGAYADLETRSGVPFHEPVGCLIASRPGGDGRRPDPIEFLTENRIAHDRWEPGDRGWTERWPRIDFPPTHRVAHEGGPAGYIRPKRLIEAQEILAARAGGTLIDDTVTAIRPGPGRDGYEIETVTGRRLRSRVVVVAAGAFTNANDLLPEPVPLRIKTEVKILGEVSDTDALDLGRYPTVTYLNDGDDLDAIYMTPPVRYPDGRACIKMGANIHLDTWPDDLATIQRWFETDTDADHLPILQPALQALWPQVEFRSFRTRPCIITYTPDHFPLIDEVRPGLVVATAGNGGGAKGADAWGEMAATLALGG